MWSGLVLFINFLADQNAGYNECHIKKQSTVEAIYNIHSFNFSSKLASTDNKVYNECHILRNFTSLNLMWLFWSHIMYNIMRCWPNNCLSTVEGEHLYWNKWGSLHTDQAGIPLSLDLEYSTTMYSTYILKHFQKQSEFQEKLGFSLLEWRSWISIYLHNMLFITVIYWRIKQVLHI